MEQQFIAWLRDRLPAHPLLRLGPGDDAAVLRMAGIDECVITVDLLTEGVDFLLAEVDPRRVGRKALAVNLSDLAAMAARPLAAVLAVALPRTGRPRVGRSALRRPPALGRKVRPGHRRRRHQQLGRPAGHHGHAARPGHRPRTALSQGGAGRRSDHRHAGLLAAASWKGNSTSSRGSTRPCCSTSATSCMPAWTSATGWRSICRGWSAKAAWARSSRRTACRSTTMPGAWREQPQRRPHAAGTCPGRRRGFRVAAGRAARRGPADARRAAAGGAADRHRPVHRRARPLAA